LELEQIVESTAIEIERITEGQRFTTKLLSERQSIKSSSDSRCVVVKRCKR